jgi:hypothetical protein
VVVAGGVVAAGVVGVVAPGVAGVTGTTYVFVAGSY